MSCLRTQAQENKRIGKVVPKTMGHYWNERKESVPPEFRFEYESQQTSWERRIEILFAVIGDEFKAIAMSHGYSWPEIDLKQIYNIRRDTVRDGREFTREHMNAHSDVVREAQKKELGSWLPHGAGDKCRVHDFISKNRAKPIPYRWVVTRKADPNNPGGYITRARLVLKGCAETHREANQTYSPAVGRDAHRYMGLVASSNGWARWSMGISTAFLQGGLFEMNEAGHERKPCGSQSDSSMWELPAELGPRFLGYAESLREWLFEVTKGVYGFKDAVLLRNLRVSGALVKELGWKQTVHDARV